MSGDNHLLNTSYKRSPTHKDLPYVFEICLVVKRRLKTLMKTHYAHGSFGHGKCTELLKKMGEKVLHYQTSYPTNKGYQSIVEEFNAVL